ncbi:MAG: hypothetical protein OEY94_05120 [Alphaproteobacteria bacterium]|nr:hypothetical protein [Alphaproteobacteria bacterium]
MAENSDLKKLQEIIKETWKSAYKIDGDKNLISTAIKPHMEKINSLVDLGKVEPVNYEAIITEAIRLKTTAKEIERSYVDIPALERNPLYVSEFKANLQALSIMTVNIAVDRNIDISDAMQKAYEEMGIDPEQQEEPQIWADAGALDEYMTAFKKQGDFKAAGDTDIVPKSLANIEPSPQEQPLLARTPTAKIPIA